jgi:hypothetical protein
MNGEIFAYVQDLIPATFIYVRNFNCQVTNLHGYLVGGCYSGTGVGRVNHEGDILCAFFVCVAC